MNSSIVSLLILAILVVGCGSETNAKDVDSGVKPAIDAKTTPPDTRQVEDSAPPDAEIDEGVEPDGEPDGPSMLNCSQLINCVVECPDTMACINACLDSSTPQTRTIYDLMISCLAAAQEGECKAICEAGGDPCHQCMRDQCVAESTACKEDA